MITVTGSLAFDYIMNYSGRFADNIMPDKIHKINLSFLLSDLQKQNGGTAGNIAYNLSLLKTDTSIFAAAGNDFDEYSNFLKLKGVDISNIQIIKDKKTASAFIMTDCDDNQITGFYPGAMSDSINYPLSDLKQKPDFVVISPNDPKAMIKFTTECQKSDIPYMLDPGMQLPALDTEDLKKMIMGATILIGNDYEIALLKEKTGLTEGKLLNQVKILITTLGAEGSIIKTSGKEIATVRPGGLRNDKGVVDPTGAGDAYRAGFLAGWIKKLDLQVCGQMGSVAACYAVEKYGTTSHSFTLEEFCERYRENFAEELTFS